MGQEGEFGGVFEELLKEEKKKEGVSFGFLVLVFYVLGIYRKGRGFYYTTHQIRRTRKQRRCRLGTRRQDQIRIRVKSVF